MSARLKFSIAVALLFCVSDAVQAQDHDAEVLSAAIAHFSNTKTKQNGEPPLLVIAGETIEAARIGLDHIEWADSPDVSRAVIRELRERNANSQTIGEVHLPANAVLVRDALSLIRRLTPTGAEVSDWSPLTHAYPGYQLVQLAAPVYFTPGQRALVYFSTTIGPGAMQGWVYVLEKRGEEWHVTSSESPWRSAAFA